MAAQRLTEWLETPKTDYHMRQWKEPYRSTVHFFDWLEKIGYIQEGQLILDLGCGMGANLHYMAQRFHSCKFIGLDINVEHVRFANEMLEGINNAYAEVGDWYDLNDKFRNRFDGVISMQTLGWLPSFETPVFEICNLNPKWQAHTSLFHEGLVSATVETQTYDKDCTPLRKLFYNVYSLPVVGKFLKQYGYGEFKYTPFEIDIDLPKTGEFRCYTEKTEDGRRIQISGPVYEPWYFIAAKRG